MRVHFHTFGCKTNQYDTERMRQEVEARGADVTTDRAAADVHVVNTCTVTNHADAEARRWIRRLRRENPAARIVVAGCSAALRGGNYRRMDGVSAVIEGFDSCAVADAVAPTARGGARSAPVPLELRVSFDRIDTEPIGGALLRRRAGGARGWLKIQDGCDRRCSFCATRLARGASRSRAPERIVAEARLLATAHAELVLTGIHIGHFGRDLDPPWTLSRLVALLLERVPGVRFRLGSVEATEVDDLLVSLMEDGGGRLARHLHMPLQSGADAVLRRMRRWHTREAYRRRTLHIVDRLGAIGLGADIIAGFPGESEEDHAQTMSMVEELPFTYLHVFPFSPRDATPAAQLDGAVPQRVAGERARALRELGHEKGRAYRARRVGQRACVVLEGRGGRALTEDYLRVEVGEPPPAGLTRLPTGTLRIREDHLYIVWPRESSLNGAR